MKFLPIALVAAQLGAGDFQGYSLSQLEDEPFELYQEEPAQQEVELEIMPAL